MSENSIPEGREYMQSRRQNIQRVQDKIERAETKGNYDKVDELREELDQMPLSVEVVRHVEIFLGVGGPTDWLDVEFYANDNAVKSVTYNYAWGSESFKTTLSPSDSLYQYAEDVAENAAEAI